MTEVKEIPTEALEGSTNDVKIPSESYEETIRKICREELQGVGARTYTEINTLIDARLTELEIDRTGIREIIISILQDEKLISQEPKSLVNKTKETKND